MKKLLFILLLTPLTQADIDRKFALTCKITDQVLLATEEGKPKRYSGFTDGLKVNDSINIDFEFNQKASVYPVYDLSLANEDFSLLATLTSSYSAEDYEGVKYTWAKKEHSLTEDNIYVQNLVGETIILNRYYKNDWELMYATGSRIGFSSAIITANCMNMPTEFDEVLAVIKDTDKDKWAKKSRMQPLDPFKEDS